MHHGPAAKMGKDYASDFKSKLGLKLFFFYAMIYAGFIVINTLKPNLMEAVIIFGLNLAVVYGFGLIIFAIILGLIYNHVCTQKENLLNKENEAEEEE